MGRSYRFECPKCHLRAHVAGGPTDGAWFKVRTIHCADCKALHDVVVEWREPVPPMREPIAKAGLKRGLRLSRLAKSTRAPTLEEALNRLTPRGKSFRWVTFKPACPVSPRHRIKEWTHPGQCPLCGADLEPSVLPFKIWE